MDFKPCQGKISCRDDGNRCLTCDRALEEIQWLRDLMDQLTNMAIEYEYGNVDEFARYVADKIPKLVGHRLGRAETISGSNRGPAHAD